MAQELLKIRESEENSYYMREVCNQTPIIVINTQCGVGKYQYNQVGIRKGELVVEFKLVVDDEFEDSEHIMHNIGEFCYLTAGQVLYAHKYFACA